MGAPVPVPKGWGPRLDTNPPPREGCRAALGRIWSHRCDPVTSPPPPPRTGTENAQEPREAAAGPPREHHPSGPGREPRASGPAPAPPRPASSWRSVPQASDGRAPAAPVGPQRPRTSEHMWFDRTPPAKETSRPQGQSPERRLCARPPPGGPRAFARCPPPRDGGGRVLPPSSGADLVPFTHLTHVPGSPPVNVR